MIYDATLFADHPYFAPVMPVLYEGQIWVAGQGSNYKATANKMLSGRSLVCVDIEGSPEADPANLLAESKRLDSEHSAPYGYFGFPSTPWAHNTNDWLAYMNSYSAVLKGTDALFSSSYPHAADKDTWHTYFMQQIAWWKKYHPKLPLYPFVWWKYETAGVPGDYIGDEYWRFMLKLSLRHTGNAVIWGGYQESWDDNAPWLRVAQEFI